MISMTPDLRRRKRIPLNTTINIYDGFSQERIGEIANIHQEGLMLISDQAIEPNTLYQYRLALPQEILGLQAIELGVDCLWTQEISNIKRYWSGFQIIDASGQALAIIDELTQNFSKPDGQ